MQHPIDFVWLCFHCPLFKVLFFNLLFDFHVDLLFVCLFVFSMMLLSLHIVIFFSFLFLWLISNFTSLWSEKIWSILENVPCALEQNVYSWFCWYNVLKKSISLTVFSLLFPPHTGCCAFIRGLEVLFLSQLISMQVREPPRVQIKFLSSFTAPRRSAAPVLSPFYLSSLSFFFLLSFPVMWRFSCPFWKSEFCCQHSVDVLWELFYM